MKYLVLNLFFLLRSQVHFQLLSCLLTVEVASYMQNQSAISRPIVPPFATRSARVDGDVGASGDEGENV
jgi:hypothetical protein